MADVICEQPLRTLIKIYRNQKANVRWAQETSRNFNIRNGTGQGRVMAAIAYCLYKEELFVRLKKTEVAVGLMVYTVVCLDTLMITGG